MQKHLLILIIITAFLACDRQETLTFSAMGDVPRQAWEDTLLPAQIRSQNLYGQSEFMLHLGDIKTGSAPCDEQVYKKVAGFLKELRVPVFIVPGDNEWNDCPDPEQAWSYWHRYFDRFEKNWASGPAIEHQKGHPENMAWISKRVLLIGINLVGGRVYDPDVWQAMMAADSTWISEQFRANGDDVYAAVVFAQARPNKKHHWFMERFITQVRSFARPVLYLHGDGHRWLYDKHWQVENLTRIQVDQGAIAVPVEIQVSSKIDSTFSFNRQPYPMPE